MAAKVDAIKYKKQQESKKNIQISVCLLSLKLSSFLLFTLPPFISLRGSTLANGCFFTATTSSSEDVYISELFSMGVAVVVVVVCFRGFLVVCVPFFLLLNFGGFFELIRICCICLYFCCASCSSRLRLSAMVFQEEKTLQKIFIIYNIIHHLKA
ncbi:hypothetical protein FF38_12647 [Lucilia cuprina]|uniref:Transmembrane protein n=1 Tax=Lucilia cuprina TaxID=7375 RepID=A0A0L0C4I0_LUCCU|nr:hypothetical protein FF38_12647 [Lucilia cuprina]